MIQLLIKKYEKYISNIQWHLDNNATSDAEKSICRQRIQDYIDIIADLKQLL